MQSPIVTLHNLATDTIPEAEIWAIAKLCLKLGRIDRSLTIAYNAAQQNTNYLQLYRTHYLEAIRLAAEFAEEIEDYNKAAYHWEQLTQQQPQDPSAWYGLGLARANLQDYRGAEMAIVRVLQLEPGNQKARSHLAQIQQMLKG